MRSGPPLQTPSSPSADGGPAAHPIASPEADASLRAPVALLKRRGARRKDRWEFERKQGRFAMLILAPSAAVILAFIAWPIVYSLVLSFSHFTIREQDWFAAGLENYRLILADRVFFTSLRFTLAFTAVYVPLSVGLALFLGVLLQQIKIGATVFRSTLFLPFVVPLTMGFLMFQWVLDPANGIFNHLLRNALGVPELAQNWLSDRDTVFGTLVAVSLWGFGPWVLMLAGLLAINKELYEAGRIDGAGHFQEFRYITVPQLRNTLMVVTTYQVIYALKIFVPIYVLTSGGPANASNSLYFLTFQKISTNKLAYASAMGWVFTLIVVTLAVIPAFLMKVRRDD